MKIYVLGANGTVGKIVVEILKKNKSDFECIQLDESLSKNSKLLTGSILINCAYDFKCLPHKHNFNNINLLRKIITLCEASGLKLLNISTQLVQCHQKDAYINTKKEIESIVSDFNGVNLRIGVLDLEVESDVLNRLKRIVKRLKFIPSNFDKIFLHLTTQEMLRKYFTSIVDNFESFENLSINSFERKGITLLNLLQTRTLIKRKLNIKFIFLITYYLAIFSERFFHKSFIVNSLTLSRLIFPCKFLDEMSRNS